VNSSILILAGGIEGESFENPRYLDKFIAKYGTKFNIPVAYYSTLMSVACGKSGKQAGLDGQIIPAKKLEEVAGK
jgi:heterodisulfide reductase subunit B